MKELNPILKRYFEDPPNAGVLKDYNYKGKDSSLRSGTVVIYYARIDKGIIKDISFRTFGCSYSIAASSFIALMAKGRDIFQAALISEDDVEKELGDFPPEKKDCLNIALGSLYSMLSSYITALAGMDTYSTDGKKITVAMSGGLDSSMAAKLLKDQGYDVIGITMKIMPDEDLPPKKRLTSWISSDIYSARRVCGRLGIPHFTIDLSASFSEKIIGPFCNEYLLGRTPNPCVECNKYIKFGKLLEVGKSLGAEYMATGHYCIVEKQPDSSSFTVKKGKDSSKEQSYVFWKLNQSQLSNIKTPLGCYTKNEIREQSRSLLPFLEQRDESQDICFIDGDRYHGFLKERIRETGSGKILNTRGEHIGEHRGFPYYTIGQRKGLGISHPRPLYVIEIIPDKNIVVAGEKEELASSRAFLKDVNFISGSPPSKEFDADVKIRYNSPAVRARVITGKGRTAEIRFTKKVDSVTPGQSAVFYDGGILLGGGIING